MTAAADRAAKAVGPARRNDHRTALLLRAVLALKRWLAQTFLELDSIPSHAKPPETKWNSRFVPDVSWLSKARNQEVFCFFFSKKKRFPAFPG
jgi:hypothetical protein